jgi:hypothetical protein
MEQSIEQLKTAVRGPLIQQEDAAYDAARKVYNGMIDKRPKLIVRAVDVGDVMVAVRYGRENGLLTAIRGGGVQRGRSRNLRRRTSDRSFADERGRVDPAARTVRVAAGCTWGDVDHATHAFGMATPCGFISTTGSCRTNSGRRYRLPDPPFWADHRQFSPERFTYQPESNTYRCPAGEQLNYVGLNVRNRAHAYIGSAKRCGACSQKTKCTTGRYKYLAIHIYEPVRQRVRELAQTPEFAKAQQQRKKVEALFAELKNQIGLRRLRLRRLMFVREQFFLAAAAQNIKRLVRFLDQQPQPILPATT